jgi:CTP:phosphocholine cytidylyltransferase-like protein
MKRNILIVDENYNNLFTLKSLLSNLENCYIIDANSGEKH